MAQIIYQIISGTPNFIASLSPANGTSAQLHLAVGVHSFDNIPEDVYTLTVVDGRGCRKYLRVDLTVPRDCEIEGEFEILPTTTTTSSSTTTIINSNDNSSITTIIAIIIKQWQ